MNDDVSFDVPRKLVLLDPTISNYTIQHLYNSVTELLNLPPFMTINTFLRGSGKMMLPSGQLSPITMVLADGWQISLQNKKSDLSQITISEGILRAEDGTIPIESSVKSKIIVS